MLGCLQSLPGFAEVFYRWDSLLGGLFVAGLAGAIQYMHSRFLEPKSGKQKHFEMVFFGTGNVGLWLETHSLNMCWAVSIPRWNRWNPGNQGEWEYAPEIQHHYGLPAWKHLIHLLMLACLWLSLLGLPIYSKKILIIYIYIGIWYVYHCANKMYYCARNCQKALGTHNHMFWVCRQRPQQLKDVLDRKSVV